MNSTPSKVFSVTIANFENSSHAARILALVCTSFPHRVIEADPDQPSTPFKIMVKSESPAAVRLALSSALGLAVLNVAEMAWLGEDGALSSDRPEFIKFEPPIKQP